MSLDRLHWCHMSKPRTSSLSANLRELGNIFVFFCRGFSFWGIRRVTNGILKAWNPMLTSHDIYGSNFDKFRIDFTFPVIHCWLQLSVQLVYTTTWCKILIEREHFWIFPLDIPKFFLNVQVGIPMLSLTNFKILSVATPGYRSFKMTYIRVMSRHVTSYYPRVDNRSGCSWMNGFYQCRGRE